MPIIQAGSKTKLIMKKKRVLQMCVPSVTQRRLFTKTDRVSSLELNLNLKRMDRNTVSTKSRSDNPSINSVDLFSEMLMITVVAAMPCNSIGAIL